jgi:hypothetical protein
MRRAWSGCPKAFRVEAGDAPALVAARARGAVHLPRYRGRTFHAPAAQAADAAVRTALAVDALDAWEDVASEELPSGGWRVRLAGEGRAAVAIVERERGEALVSCSPAKHKAVDAYSVVEWHEEVR